MPNSYFQFKQFKIEQGAAGMKVTTDGCLFGAVVPCPASGKVLDIGVGTGLLSLMLAQRCQSEIHAIEINSDAFRQAKENIINSPWSDRIKIYHSSLQHFKTDIQYDLIICNPPFFKGHQKGQSNNKNQAIHDDTLPMNDLLENVSRLLSSNGEFWVMYPAAEMGQFELIAREFNLNSKRGYTVTNTPDGSTFRKIQCFSRASHQASLNEEISIRTADNEYTPDFIRLLKNYYLHL